MSTTPTVTALQVPLINQPQTLTIALAGIIYQLFVYWNDQAQCWQIDIADNQGNWLVRGIAMVTGANLLEQYGYLNFGGQLIAQTTNLPDDVPTFVNLGTLGNLYFVTVDDE